MTIEKAEKATAGLGVLKFSLDALNDAKINQLEARANYNEQLKKYYI